MNITITGRHINVSDSLKEYAEKKITKLETYFNQLIDAHIVMFIEKQDHVTDVVINGDGVQFHGREKAADLYSTVDLVFEKLERQVVKYKEKHQSHKSGGEKKGFEGYTGEVGEKVVLTQVSNKPLDKIEAYLQMKNDNVDFMLFKKGISAVDSNVDYSNKSYAVIYKNNDDYKLLAIPFDKIKEHKFENDTFIEYKLNVLDASPANPNIEFKKVENPLVDILTMDEAIEKASDNNNAFFTFFNIDSQYFNIIQKSGDSFEVLVPAF